MYRITEQATDTVPETRVSIALYERFDSRAQKRFAHHVIAALRQQFGGHAVRKG